MTKSEMFDYVQELDGDGLVITDTELLARAVDNSDILATDPEWMKTLQENVSED